MAQVTAETLIQTIQFRFEKRKVLRQAMGEDFHNVLLDNYVPLTMGGFLGSELILFTNLGSMDFFTRPQSNMKALKLWRTLVCIPQNASTNVGRQESRNWKTLQIDAREQHVGYVKYQRFKYKDVKFRLGTTPMRPNIRTRMSL